MDSILRYRGHQNYRLVPGSESLPNMQPDCAKWTLEKGLVFCRKHEAELIEEYEGMSQEARVDMWSDLGAHRVHSLAWLFLFPG